MNTSVPIQRLLSRSRSRSISPSGNTTIILCRRKGAPMGDTIRPDPYSLPVRYEAKHQKKRSAPSNPSGKPHGAPAWHGSNVICHHRWLQRMERVWNSSGENNRHSHTGHHMRGGFSSWSHQLKGPCPRHVCLSAIRGSICSPKGMILVPIRSASPCRRQLSRLG